MDPNFAKEYRGTFPAFWLRMDRYQKDFMANVNEINY
jgi:hypothetical protein